MILRNFDGDERLCDICLREKNLLVELIESGLFICQECTGMISDTFLIEEMRQEKKKFKILKGKRT